VERPSGRTPWSPRSRRRSRPVHAHDQLQSERGEHVEQFAEPKALLAGFEGVDESGGAASEFSQLHLAETQPVAAGADGFGEGGCTFAHVVDIIGPEEAR